MARNRRPNIAPAMITTGRKVSTVSDRTGLISTSSTTPPIRVMLCDKTCANVDDTVYCTAAASDVNRDKISPVRFRSKNGTGRRTTRSKTDLRRSATTPSPTRAS